MNNYLSCQARKCVTCMHRKDLDVTIAHTVGSYSLTIDLGRYTY